MSRTVSLWFSTLIGLGLLTTSERPATAQTPSIKTGGILNAASFIVGGPIAQGSLFSIFGLNIGPPAPGATATSYPLQIRRGGRTVPVPTGRRPPAPQLPICPPPTQITHT